MNKKLLILAAMLILPLTTVYADPFQSGHHGHHLERLSKELSLDAEQKAKVETIFKEEHEKFRALHEEAHNKIKEVLTAEQSAKWEKIISEHKEKHPHHKDEAQ